MTEIELADLLRRNPDLSVSGDMLPCAECNSRQSTIGSEYELHVAIIAECHWRALTNPVWGQIFHPANGELRNKAVAGKLKAMGVRKGILDLYLLVPRHGFHGLALELKYGKNELTPEQRTELRQLRADGYYTNIVRSYEQGIEILEWYLQKP